jgi:AcrR family transcriptional regulator
MKQLSVARVACEVGLVPSALYRHYRSKDEMLDSVLDYIQGRLVNNLREVCEETEDAVERIHRLLIRHLRLVKESPALPRVVFAQGVFSDDFRRRKKVYKLFSEYLGSLSSIVEIGQKEGRIREDARPETIALMLIGIVQPSAFLWHLSNGRFDPAGHGRKAWKLFAEMIRPKRAKWIK